MLCNKIMGRVKHSFLLRADMCVKTTLPSNINYFKRNSRRIYLNFEKVTNLTIKHGGN